MTRVTFYILQDTHAEARHHYACMLAEQLYQQGQHVLIRAENPAQCDHLDERLWSFRDDSFIPHERAGHPGPSAPVQIDCRDQPGRPRQALINLDLGVPDKLGHFSQIFEIVVDEESCKQMARERFRCYQKAGCPPSHHPIRHRILSQFQSRE